MALTLTKILVRICLYCSKKHKIW